MPNRLPLCAATLLLAGSAYAQCSPDQVQDQWNGGTSERNLPGYSEWQSFTAGEDGALCQVDLLFCNSDDILNGSGTLNIYQGEGLSGPLLATQSVIVNGTAYTMNQPFWQAWTVNTPPLVESDALYTFQFVPAQNGGLPDPYLIQIYLPSIYPGGINANLGAQGDCTFRTYVGSGSTAVPEAARVSGPLRVFPVPADGSITVEAPGVGGADVVVLDAAGTVVLRQRLSAPRGTLAIEALPPGLYVLRSIQGTVTACARFVKR